MTMGKDRNIDIAICGMSLRVAGGISTPSELWAALCQGQDMQEPVPAQRYNIHGFTEKLGGKNGLKSLNGYFIETAELGSLDVSHFQMSKDELAKCDPQQCLMLETTYEALADAGVTEYSGKPIGCYVGTSAEDWLRMSARELQHTQGNVLGGVTDFMLPNRVSYQFNFKGPSFAVKTGCSASLIALHLACTDLRTGSISGAVVGGTSLLLDPTMTSLMASDGIISPTGSCNTFDAKADGFARADGVAVLYIKRMDDALRDGNPIRAVIKGTGSNTDGRNTSGTAGLMQPNGEAQEALMRKTYADAGLDPHSTGFVELHGTGTPVGDPIECKAVGQVFGRGNLHGIYIGSVKPNVGHTEAASGLVSVIKAVMALEQGLIPPNIKFTEPHPDIPFTELGLKVPTKLTPFPANRCRRVSVNSFGVGGSNAHVILDAVPKPMVEKLSKLHSPQLLLFSANTQSSLERNKERFKEFIERNQHTVPDIAYTIGRRRQILPHRAFQIVDGRGQVIGESSNMTKTPKESSKIVMVFTGQGAQWPRMGADLIDGDSRFRADLDRMDHILQTLQKPPEWHIIDELKKAPDASNISKARFSQPLCTVLQIALFHRFSDAGVIPHMVIGHSSGEIAASYAAGKISLEAAIILAYYRGLAGEDKASTLSSIGAMAAISLGSRQVSPFLLPGVVVACENSPSNTTISGDKKAVEAVICRIKTNFPEADCRPLRVDLAYHSHDMKSPAQIYARDIQRDMERRTWAADRTARFPTEIGFVSTLLGKTCNEVCLQTPTYWAQNLASPVRFATAVAFLFEDAQLEKPLFLEVGPHAALAGPLRQNCAAAGQQCDYITSLTRSRDSRVSLLSAFGDLFLRGVNVDWSSVFPTGKAIGGLPPYAWDHSNVYWYESRLSKEWRFRKFPHHCLLGSRLVESSDIEPIWRNMLHLENEPWLADHKVQQDVVYPLVCYAAMAGEAVRQLTGLEDGYTVKDLVVRAALVLLGSAPVEILTRLRRHRISDVDFQSKWFNFSIVSCNGTSWTVHCEGLIKACSKVDEPSQILRRSTFGSLPRKVNVPRFYEALTRAGITYGPEFQLLDSVFSDTTQCQAQGKILPQHDESSQYFVQHPVMMDACFQLVFVSLARGLARKLNRILMPTKIHELHVRRYPVGAKREPARVAASGTENSASVECMMGGSVLLYIGGAEFSQLEDDFIDQSDGARPESVDPHAAARLHWLPDASCIDVGSLIRPPKKYCRMEVMLLEELTLLCIIESAELVERLQPAVKFMEKYRVWLSREVAAARRDHHPFIKNPAALVRLSSAERKARMDLVYKSLLNTERASLPIAVKRIHEDIEALFEGKKQVLDVLMRNNELTKLYGHLSFDYGDFVRMISHWRPTLRILEVGAGTGATTEMIIRSLLDRGPNRAGLPAYSIYTFTDISASFFFAAKQRFSYAPNMEYKVLDVSLDALSQGFEPRSYDVIFAANVLHATKSLAETLRNLWPLLKPGGMIVITELCCVKRCAGYIFGTLPGWWLGAEDDREWEPYVPVSRWDQELKMAGFTGVETARYDDEQPYHFSAAMVSRQLDINQKKILRSRSVTILSEMPQAAPALPLIERMRQEGWEVSLSSIGQVDELQEDTDIICCLDLEAEFLENLTEQSFYQFQRLIKRLTVRQKMLWLARPVQLGCKDPRSAMGVGVAKAVRAELGVGVFTLEIDDSEIRFSELVEQVFMRIRREEEEAAGEKLQTDKEFAVINGVVCTGRYYAFSLRDELADTTSALAAAGYTTPWHSQQKQTRKCLKMDRPGRMETLRWVEEPICEIKDDNVVELEPHYVGLNFRDVVMANGLLKLPDESPSLSGFGAECAGIVTRTGRDVKGFSTGDRVMALAAGGCLSTRIVLSALQVAKVPDHMSLEEAASIPACFSTVWRAVCELGRLESGQTILIHSACGGVGLAAVQVCKLIGAKIYATVSSSDKVDHLVRAWDIPQSRIFDSRSATFHADLLRETEGKGVDLVLNSLSGDLLDASWKCVAPFGTLIELGKRDITAAGKLEMQPFLQNRSYSCVNMAQIVREKPEWIGRIMGKLTAYFDQGKLLPLSPRQLYTPLEMHRAFLDFQKGAHIGKLLVRLGHQDVSFEAAPMYRPISFRPDATYLLVGGLGGLGRSIATWMAERGARHLTFLSRSAGLTAKSNELFVDLSSMGCHATAVAGCVSNVDDVRRAIKSSTHPIRGIFQLAMVLKDSSISKMWWSDWCTVVQPKVKGTYHLHHELLSQPLDFFWMASSLVTVIEQVGQGNYGAANMYLEAFAQYRRSIGLPASVLNISPIDGVGYVAEHPHAKRSITFQNMGFESEAAFLDALELSLLCSAIDVADDEAPQKTLMAHPPRPWTNKSQIVMGLRSTSSLDDSSARTNWRFNRRMGFYHNRKLKSTEGGAGAEGGDVVDQVVRSFVGRVLRNTAVLESESELASLARTIALKVLDMTLKPADTVLNPSTATLAELGIDSLMAVELRRWFRSAFGIQVSALEIMQAGTLLQLGQVVASKLKEKYS